MKDGFKSATIIATLNLLSWKKDYRVWSVGTVIMVLIIRYLIGVPLYALPNGKTSTALLLPVLLADAMNSNGLLKVLIFFGGILFTEQGEEDGGRENVYTSQSHPLFIWHSSRYVVFSWCFLVWSGMVGEAYGKYPRIN